ncbi:hypothetical protein [Georgenia faecalis]|uniref:DNA-directed RNA polymerase subunit beta n=1 Tax=Georgenia faecalis TaxID=2483799 RepID=A0ABV9DBU8_9MICO|nr:hypothetical protein [Georgenia faecalis]
MDERAHPRRPAMLDPQEADSIEGDSDPALTSEVAHATARITVFGAGDDPDDVATAQRLAALVEDEGLDAVAELWSRSPANTLPGALWRVYLLREWIRRDPETVAERYRAGLGQVPATDADAPPPAPADVEAAADGLFSGALAGEFDGFLDRTADLLRILAAGAEAEPVWLTHDDGLAGHVTRRPGALLATAEELEHAAGLARAGQLD